MCACVMRVVYIFQFTYTSLLCTSNFCTTYTICDYNGN